MKNTLFSKHTFFVLIFVFFIVPAASGLSDAVFAAAVLGLISLKKISK